MRNLFIVMKFTMKEMVRKKAFIVSTILILLMIVIGFCIPKIIKAIKGEETKDKIIIVDSQNIFEGNLELLKQINPEDYEISFENITFDEVKKKIEEDQIEAAIIIEKDSEKLKLRYVVENTRWIERVPDELITAINSMYSNIQIGKLGLTQKQLKALTPNFETSIEQTSEKEEVKEENITMMIVISLALYLAVILFAAQVAMSVSTEKTSRIMETLVTSTTPKTIVLGKTLGIGFIGLMQVLIIIITAVVSAKLFLEQEILNLLLDMSNITIQSALITIIYFVLGYFIYSLVYALTGSMVSKPEDIQSANGPVSLIAGISFYLGYFAILINPTSSISTFASIFPFSSPFCMPARVMSGLASRWEIAGSIALLFVLVLIIAKIAIKVYSSAILNYGSKMSFKDAFKIFKDK